MAIIAFIPARSGSTRLKNKNILLVNKKPLIFWSLKTAIEIKVFDSIIFSSDSKKYYDLLIKSLKESNLSTKKIIFDLRNKEQSGKKKKIFDYIKHDLIDKFNFSKKDLIVQMLPTSPLRTKKSLKSAINLSIRTKKNVFTVSEFDFHLSFALSIDKKNKWKALFVNSPLNSGNTQSQDQKIFFRPNPIANCLWVKNINKKTKSIYENALSIKTSKLESIDIDNYEDFLLVKAILEG